MTELIKNVVSGMATIIALPDKSDYLKVANPNCTSFEAIKKDWENVGRDIFSAIQKVTHDR